MLYQEVGLDVGDALAEGAFGCWTGKVRDSRLFSMEKSAREPALVCWGRRSEGRGRCFVGDVGLDGTAVCSNSGGLVGLALVGTQTWSTEAGCRSAAGRGLVLEEAGSDCIAAAGD